MDFEQITRKLSRLPLDFFHVAMKDHADEVVCICPNCKRTSNAMRVIRCRDSEEVITKVLEDDIAAMRREGQSDKFIQMASAGLESVYRAAIPHLEESQRSELLMCKCGWTFAWVGLIPVYMFRVGVENDCTIERLASE